MPLKYSKMQLRYCLSLRCSIFKMNLFSEFITELAGKCCYYCQFRLRGRISHCVTCNSCVAVALFSGFFTKHWLTKSLKDSDHRSGFLNVGGGLVGIMKIAWENTNKSLCQLFVLQAPETQTLYHVYTHSHRMDVSVGRFTLCHLYGRDAQGPDVSHTVVANLLDHLRGHPERSTDYSVSLCHGVLQR